MGETFYLIEKITSPAHYANFASLICSVRRGINNLPFVVQFPFVQFFISVAFPEQSAPPLEGVGLLQSRERFWVPLPQVTLHELQAFQLPHSPSLIHKEIQYHHIFPHFLPITISYKENVIDLFLNKYRPPFILQLYLNTFSLVI